LSKRHILPCRKFHTELYSEDLDFLEARFGRSGDRFLGVGRAIREIVHKRVREMKSRIQAEVDRQQSAESQQSEVSK
jgi:hypothetical protein